MYKQTVAKSDNNGEKAAFQDMKNHLDDSAIHKILSYCVFDGSPEGIAKDIAQYRNHSSWRFYGWVEKGEILGICGFEVHADYVEILHVSVAEKARNRGIGSAMVAALQEKYGLRMEAETDDDAVDFYRKRGFQTTAFQKYNVRRYHCVLPVKQAETDEERQARIYPVILSEYNPAWSEWYEEEKSNLERLIGKASIVRVSHIGSTSVVGLLAKPTVDILLEMKENTDIQRLIAKMPEHDYICLKQQTVDSPDCVMFLKGYLHDGFAEKVFHIHVRYSKNWDELYFRDYLIAHPETAAEYAALKRSLFKDYEHNRDGYTAAKGEFIKEVTAKAREELL